MLPLNKINKRLILVLILGLIVLLVVYRMITTQTTPAPTQKQQDPTIIDLKHNSSLNQWQIHTVKLIPSHFTKTIHVSGKVDFNGLHLARIGAAIPGRVNRILIKIGDEVHDGTILAEIKSPELGQMELNYLKALANMSLAQHAAERADILFKNDVISQAELQRRLSEAKTSAAEVHSIADQLHALGMTNPQITELTQTGVIHSTASVISTIDGTVVERKVSQGQVVQPSDSLFTVSDLSTVWVTADIPEQEAPEVAVGQNMFIEIPGLQQNHFEGRLTYVGEMVNPDSRTINARAELPNKNHELRPGMLANLSITGKDTLQLVVPSKAVVTEENHDYVFIQVGDSQYKLVQVNLGEESNGLRPVISGLDEGTVIVSDEVFHLNNELKKNLTNSTP